MKGKYEREKGPAHVQLEPNDLSIPPPLGQIGHLQTQCLSLKVNQRCQILLLLLERVFNSFTKL